MPIHQFYHEESGDTIDVYVPASAPTEQHSQQTHEGKVYRRVYAAPLAARDIGYGDGTAADFRRKTSGEKRGLKVGDLWEISAEMSERRKQQQGVDVVKEQHYATYEKEYGEKHPDVMRRERAQRTNERLKEWGIKVTP